MNIKAITQIPCNSKNYKKANRGRGDIAYIVLHYTSNINDTDKNNGVYFRDNVTGSSAHYFVRDDSITQSVQDKDIAWAVGLGSMKKPYINNPTHYGICTNTNSISIEMCGGIGTREATAATKTTTAQLAAYLLDYYQLPTTHLIMHYNVTGKQCPAWMVEDPAKYQAMVAQVNKYRAGEKEDKDMTQEKFDEMWRTALAKYETELSKQEANWEGDDMTWAEQHGFIRDGQPKVHVTRGQLATILHRVMEALKWEP